jgi:urea transport system substrate-binding protein
MAVEKAGTTNVDKVKAASKGLVFDAPEGKVTIDGENQHIHKTARIGQLQPDGLIDEVHGSDEPIKPDPFLKTYPWAAGL